MDESNNNPGGKDLNPHRGRSKRRGRNKKKHEHGRNGIQSEESRQLVEGQEEQKRHSNPNFKDLYNNSGTKGEQQNEKMGGNTNQKPENSEMTNQTHGFGENLLSGLASFLPYIGPIVEEFGGNKKIKTELRDLIKKYNDLIGICKKMERENSRLKSEAKVYKEGLEQLFSGKEPVIKYRKYDKKWSAMDRVVYILQKNRRKKLTVPEIWAIMQDIHPEMKFAWDDPLHSISDILSRAVKYERVERIDVPGSGRYYYRAKIFLPRNKQ